MSKYKPGPQGRYPSGRPQRSGDRGALVGALQRVRGQRQLALELGTLLTWVAVPPVDALAQAAAIRALVHRHWGELPYNPTTLPIRVEPQLRTGQIESHFPERLSVLRADPEVFLAWADRLEEAVAQLAGEAADA